MFKRISAFLIDSYKNSVLAQHSIWTASKLAPKFTLLRFMCSLSALNHCSVSDGTNPISPLITFHYMQYLIGFHFISQQQSCWDLPACWLLCSSLFSLANPWCWQQPRWLTWSASEWASQINCTSHSVSGSREDQAAETEKEKNQVGEQPCYLQYLMGDWESWLCHRLPTWFWASHLCCVSISRIRALISCGKACSY